jgi:short-chain 2-methylacyl-CoA dehydrogenase
MTVDG